jgi:Flp pilus assembly protein TadB
MTLSLVLLSGLLVTAGLLSLVVAVVPSVPRLEDALSRVSAVGAAGTGDTGDIGPVGSRSERLGAWLYRRSPTTLTDQQRRNLRLQDKSVAEFYSDKAVMALVGCLTPALLAVIASWASGTSTPYPAVVALLGTVIGFFTPDLLLRQATKSTRPGAVEALLVYMDLVTLERLANASATQALQNAAELSEAPVFAQIRVALERAQLEQQSPYAELRRLAEQLDLPELADVADVMQLDETGAALSGALRARVRELRDAHLSQQQVAASAAAEGMTLYMTLPALIFGLIFMVPPLMKIVLG